MQRKKIIIICAMVILLAATAYVNILLNNKTLTPVNNDNDNIVEVSHFVTYRKDREDTRKETFAYLDSIINSETVSEQSKIEAEVMKLNLCTLMELELVVEGLIKYQGYDDAVVTMNSNNINIVVSSSELTSAQVAQILSIVTTETEYTADKVVVYPYSA